MFRILFCPILTLLLGFIFTANNSIPQPKAAGYPEHLPGAFTGGFGEETCHSCHFDYPLNPEDGSLSVERIPETFKAGKAYTFEISVRREKLGQAGFQLSSRFEDGSQAGSFNIDSDRLQFTKSENKIQYLQHSLKGSRINNQPSASWTITWVAPDSTFQNIIFNIVANAGNGDASAFGDFIFVREIEMRYEPN